MKEKREISHAELLKAAVYTAYRINSDFKNHSSKLKIFPVPRGGVACTYAVLLYINENWDLVHSPEDADIAIDDIVDSGETRKKILSRNPKIKFYALYENPTEWIVFPFEKTLNSKDTSIDDAIIRILEYKGKLDIINIEDAKQCILNSF